MPVTRLLRAGMIALLATLLLTTSSAANERLTPADVGAWDAPVTSAGEDSWVPQYVDGRSAFSRWAAGKAESSGSVESLPPESRNVELVGELQMDTPDAFKFNPSTGLPDPSQPDVMPGQIADLAVYKNIAYLNSWSDASCRRGGIFVVDISNPSRPRQVSFLPAASNTRHGEGAIVLTMNTPAGPMDVLAVNNEPMPFPCPQTVQNAGGFDLWNVTNPNNPVPLKLNVGDTGPDDGSLVGAEPVHQSHSTTMWTDDRGRTFVSATDNLEFHDLDIFEITNDPANPRPVAEFDILDRFPQVYDNSAYGDWIYNHDMSVRKIKGVWTLLLDYWDAGYVTLNVDNPADPQYIGDTSFDGPDPLMPRWDPPEGNAHQGEFSHDGEYILGADEDFDTHRLVSEIAGEPVTFGFGLPVTSTTPTQLRSDLVPAPGDPIEGDTRFIGEACSLASVPAPQPGETVAIAARGTCDFEDKAMFAEQAGYDAVLIMQNGVGAAPRCDATNLNMTTDNLPVPVTIKMLLIPRTIGFRMLGVYDEATYACDPANPAANTPNPPVGTGRSAGQAGVRVRRLGLHARVQERGGQASAGRLVRDPGGPRRELRDRLRRPHGPRVRHGSDGVPRLQLLLRRRHAGLPLRSRRADRGRQLHPGARRQLLGRGAVQPERRPVLRGLRPRLRPVHLPLQGPWSGPAAGVHEFDGDECPTRARGRSRCRARMPTAIRSRGRSWRRRPPGR